MNKRARQSFHRRGEHEYPSAGHVRKRIGLKAQEGHLLANPQPRCKRFQPRSLRPLAKEHKPYGTAFGNDGKGAQQRWKVLEGNEPSGRQHDRDARILEPRMAHGRPRLAPQRLIDDRVHDDFDHVRGFRRNAPQVFSDGRRDCPDRVRPRQQQAHRREDHAHSRVEQFAERAVDDCLAHDQAELAANEPLGHQRRRATLFQCRDHRLRAFATDVVHEAGQAKRRLPGIQIDEPNARRNASPQCAAAHRDDQIRAEPGQSQLSRRLQHRPLGAAAGQRGKEQRDPWAAPLVRRRHLGHRPARAGAA